MISHSQIRLNIFNYISFYISYSQSAFLTSLPQPLFLSFMVVRCFVCLFVCFCLFHCHSHLCRPNISNTGTSVQWRLSCLFISNSIYCGFEQERRVIGSGFQLVMFELLNSEYCLLLLIQHSSGICSPYVFMYCLFRPIVAIIKYIEPLQSLFLLSAIPPYSGQCLHTGIAMYLWFYM